MAKITKDITLGYSDLESIDNAVVPVLQTGIRLTESRKGRLNIVNQIAKVKLELQKEGLGKLLAF